MARPARSSFPSPLALGLWASACAPAVQEERAIDPACLPLRTWAAGACQQRVADFRACPGPPAELFRACTELCSSDFPCSAGAAAPPVGGAYATAATLALADPPADGIGDTQFGRALLREQTADGIAIAVRQQQGYLCGPAGPLSYPAALFGEDGRFTLFSALLRRTPERCTLTLMAQSGALAAPPRPRAEVRTKYLNLRCQEQTGYLREYVETWRPDEEADPCVAP